MRLLDRLPRLVYAREYRQSGLADGPQWLIDTWGGARTASGERISIDGSLAIADVFSAVDYIAETVSTLPLKVFRDMSLTPGNSGKGIIEATDHRAYRMLHDMPNPYTPAHRFWSVVTSQILLWGNCFIEKMRGPDGLVSELRLCAPDGVEVQFSEVSGVKRYIVTRQDGTREGPFSDERILHVFGLSKDGLVGMSRITQAREALGVAKARVRFEGDVYGSKPYLSGVIEHPSTIKDSGVKLRESWRALYGSGSKDRHGVGVLEEGAKFNAITAPLEDMQFVEATRMSKTEIAVLFKLPPALLGGSTGDSLTYQTVEGNKIQFATQAIAPVANNIAQFISHDFSIFPFQSWYAEFVLEGMLRGDSKARAEYWASISDTIGLDPEYIAARENIPLSALKKPEPVPAALVPSGTFANGTSEPNGTMAPVNGNA